MESTIQPDFVESRAPVTGTGTEGSAPPPVGGPPPQAMGWFSSGGEENTAPPSTGQFYTSPALRQRRSAHRSRPAATAPTSAQGVTMFVPRSHAAAPAGGSGSGVEERGAGHGSAAAPPERGPAGVLLSDTDEFDDPDEAEGLEQSSSLWAAQSEADEEFSSGGEGE